MFVWFGIANCLAQTVPAWRTEGALPVAVTGHQSVPLPDGNVLIAGGINASGAVSSVCTIYDAATGQSIAANSLSEPRAHFCMVAVPTSANSVRIFAIGGYTGQAGSFSTLSSVEFMDYSIGASSFQWKNAGSLATSRADARAAMPNPTQIIVTGGYTQSGGAIRTGTILSSCEGINASTGLVFGVPNMTSARAGHLACAFRDENGGTSLMVSGGESPENASTEIFTNGSWTLFANPPKAYRRFGLGFGDCYGTARVFGGFGPANSAPQITCEWYDVKAGWKYSPSMNLPRSSAPVSQIVSIRDTLAAYMVAGGATPAGTTAECEYYTLPTKTNPTGTWIKLQPMQTAASDRTLNILGSNLPIVTGGAGQSGSAIAGIEIFQPLRANDAPFGPEEIGRISDSIVITIRNEWVLPVTVTNFRIDKSAEFFFTGDTSKFTLAPGASRRVFVRFVPNDVGTRSSRLLFNVSGVVDSVRLSGTGIISKIVLQTKNLSFGNVYLGSDSLICFPAIKNTGTDTTYIDSITVAPVGDFRIVSPLGRCTLAPDSVITVCARFAPTKRGQAFATASLNIGTRRFPCALDGTGVLKYIKAYSAGDCDTVSLEPNKVYHALLTLRNPGDSAVSVSSFSFTGANSALFSIPMATPFSIPPGGNQEVIVNFAPLTEGEYKTVVRAANDGAKDSIASAQVCFVVRSRSVSFMSGTVMLGEICTGDTARQMAYIQNPSSYDTIRIDSITVSPQSTGLSFTQYKDTLLAPKAIIPLNIVFSSDAVGPRSYSLVCHTSFGPASNTITATVLPALGLGFSQMNYTADLAEKWSAKLVTSSAIPAEPVRNAHLLLTYDASLLHFIGIVPSGANPLDMAKTNIIDISRNSKLLNLYWQNDLVPSADVLSFEFETLLAGTNVSQISITKADSNRFCFESAGAIFRVGESCSGRTKLVIPTSVVVAVSIEGGAIEAIIDSKLEIGSARHEIVDLLGRTVYSSGETVIPAGTSRVAIGTSGLLPAGVYCYRIISNGKAIITKMLPIVN